MPYTIAMVSDFFFPQPGGVEAHIYQLSTKLIDLGHKVIIITHAYPPTRTGIRYLTNGLKVYHVPFLVIYRESTFPTVFSFFPIFRNIVIREGVEIVHGHASLSSLCHEAILHARTMGLRTVFTDHSLFGFGDAGSILTNKLLKFTLSDVDHVVGVSHTCKENTVLRASLDPLMVSVIPNAVVSENFAPLPSNSRAAFPSSGALTGADAHHHHHTHQKRGQQEGGQESNPRHRALQHHKAGGAAPRKMGNNETITIVVISRLFYNKGTDLLIAAIPPILAADPHIRFIIAGSGPKAIDLEQMLERHVLQDRVTLLGPVRHEEVRDIMVRGHIYLNPSLTEAFGTVIVEAASCGLYVVATQVGGIPEVLPEYMVEYARPDAGDIVRAVGGAVGKLRGGGVRTEGFHEAVGGMYSWRDVARRTERVYDGVTGRIEEEDFYGASTVGGMGVVGGAVGNGGGVVPAPIVSQTADGAAPATAVTTPDAPIPPGWTGTRGPSFSLIDRLKRYYGCGIWAGKLFCLCVVVDYLIFQVLELIWPRDGIDVCVDWPRKGVGSREGAMGEDGGSKGGDGAGGSGDLGRGENRKGEGRSDRVTEREKGERGRREAAPVTGGEEMGRGKEDERGREKEDERGREKEDERRTEEDERERGRGRMRRSVRTA